MNTTNQIQILNTGILPYDRGLELQAATADKVRAGEVPGVIITIRHTPVVTLGHRGTMAEVHLSADDLRARGIDFHIVDRGGGATYHYPAQAVLYPILDLNRLKVSVTELLEASGAAVMECLDACGVHGHWDESRPGVYMEDGAKIASIGFHLSKGITTHGIAVNTGRGWDGFTLIDPCKVKGQPITSVEDRTGTSPDPDAFANSVAESLRTRLLSKP